MRRGERVAQAEGDKESLLFYYRVFVSSETSFPIQLDLTGALKSYKLGISSLEGRILY